VVAAFNPRYKRAPGEVVDTSRFVGEKSYASVSILPPTICSLRSDVSADSGPGFFPVVTPEYGRIRRKQRLYRMRTHRWANSGVP
jgi:hypothetical protein